MDYEHVQITTTFASEADAQELADHLTGAGLAACAQVLGPITSSFRWKGKLEKATEWMCVMKSRSALAGRLVDVIGSRHPYETPEITVIPIVGGSARYLDWIAAETEAATRGV